MRPARPAYQHGMVLLLCLIFLTALTLLGLSASADALLHEKLSSNLQDSERARQTALAALSWAEQWLFSLSGPAPETCTDACAGLRVYPPGHLPLGPESESFTWWAEHGHEAGTDPFTGERIETLGAGSATAPTWILETMQAAAPSDDETADLEVWYRILARGSGHAATSVSVVESTVVRSWPGTAAPQSPDTEPSGLCPGTAEGAPCERVNWRALR